MSLLNNKILVTTLHTARAAHRHFKNAATTSRQPIANKKKSSSSECVRECMSVFLSVTRTDGISKGTTIRTDFRQNTEDIKCRPFSPFALCPLRSRFSDDGHRQRLRLIRSLPANSTGLAGRFANISTVNSVCSGCCAIPAATEDGRTDIDRATN